MNKEEKHEELWKPLKFIGLKRGEKYEISNMGQLRYYYDTEHDWKIMKTTNSNKNGTGYVYFTWFKSSKGWKHRITKPIHRLVAEAFCPRPSMDYKFVVHKDYNKTNNKAENLEWVDQRGLTLHNLNKPKKKKATTEDKKDLSNDE